MIDPHIEIVLDDDHRWFVQSRGANGTTTRRTYGSRKSLMDAMPYVLAEVRGIAYPSIDIPGDTLGAPQRRAGD